MRMLKWTALVLIIATVASCKVSDKMEKKELTTELEKVSYAFGMNIATNMKAQGVEGLDIAAFNKGLNDVFGSDSLQMTQMETQQLIRTYLTDLREKQSEKMKKEGADFLLENAKKDAITTTESGLQYEVLTEGTGATPTLTDKVKVHYHGTLIDGTVFDSSVERNKPIQLSVNGVIKGWTEALQMMKVGAKWKLYIPYDLAYGERGSGQVIPPYAALIFEVELLGIEE